MAACVLPVPAALALRWIAGEVGDTELIRAAGPPECVFVVDLPDRAAYAGMLVASRHWRAMGAVCLIARTGTPTVAARLAKFDGRPFYHEATDPPKDRWLVPPAGFARWLDRLEPRPESHAPAVASPAVVA